MSSEDATAGLKSTQYIVTDTLKREVSWKQKPNGKIAKGNVLKLNKTEIILFTKRL